MTNRIRTAQHLTPGRPSGEVLVVIPTFEEAENIMPLFAALAALTSCPDLLVVDDGSTDGTANAVRTASAGYPARVYLLERAGKCGLGTAYCDAFQWALLNVPDARVIVQMDADLSHDPADIPGLVQAAHAHGACVGSRYVLGGSMPDWKLARQLLSRSANVYARVVLRLRGPAYDVHDSTAGFAAWRQDVLQRLMQQAVPGTGYGFQISMKWFAYQSGVSIHEHPITFRARRVGQSKLSKHIVIEALQLPWIL